MTEDGRMPPHDANAEAAVVGAAILDAGACKRAASGLEPEDFYIDPHRQTFAAVQALHRAGQPVDLVTVITWLRDRNRLQQVGGSAAVTEMTNAAATLAGVPAYIRTVRAKARVRATVLAAQRVVAEGYAGDYDDAEFLSRSSRAVADAAKLPDSDVLKSNRDALAAIVKQIDKAHQRGSMVVGVPTGIDAYDRLTLGLHAKSLNILAARPGAGKTALAGTIARNIAMLGMGVLFFSMEMSSEEILSRCLSSMARIDGMNFKTGQLGPSSWTRLHEQAVVLAKLPLWLDDRTGLTVHDMANRALGAIDESRARGVPLGAIVVDYLQKVAVPEKDGRQQRYVQVGNIAKGLKQLARDTGLPVIALAQLKRLGKEQDRRPVMDDLRESGDIEQEADTITFIAKAEEEPETMRLLIVEKARGGRPGTVACRWVPEFTLFENLLEGEWQDHAAQ